jgi:hypothetical protein
LPPWTTTLYQHVPMNYHIDHKRAFNYHFCSFSPFRQSDPLTRTVNGSCAHHVSLSPALALSPSWWTILKQKKNKKKNKKKMKNEKWNNKKSTPCLVKGIDFLSQLNFKQQGALEGGVEFLKSKNAVFTEERSNIWGAHVPLWSTCMFEDFLYWVKFRTVVLGLYSLWGKSFRLLSDCSPFFSFIL